MGFLEKNLLDRVLHSVPYTIVGSCHGGVVGRYHSVSEVVTPRLECLRQEAFCKGHHEFGAVVKKLPQKGG